jgi:voltage-gated potassium channel
MAEATRDMPGQKGFKEFVRHLYHGEGSGPQKFRLFMLGFDILTLIFFVISSMFDPKSGFHWIDYPIALFLLADLAARTWISHTGWRYLLQFHSIADILVIFSLVAHLFTDNLAFLRVVRMLRLFRSYRLLAQLRVQSKYFARNEDIIHSSLNLLIFIFVITAVVYVVEGRINPKIENYFDALYFTVTTLTTTGFGDIVMTGTAGKMVAVVIMVLGVGLFLRLIQTIFRPSKVNFPCPACGLKRHDADAVHCKHCGHVLNIPDEGFD